MIALHGSCAVCKVDFLWIMAVSHCIALKVLEDEITEFMVFYVSFFVAYRSWQGGFICFWYTEKSKFTKEKKNHRSLGQNVVIVKSKTIKNCFVNWNKAEKNIYKNGKRELKIVKCCLGN